jgi:hypothetical protein
VSADYIPAVNAGGTAYVNSILAISTGPNVYNYGTLSLLNTYPIFFNGVDANWQIGRNSTSISTNIVTGSALQIKSSAVSGEGIVFGTSGGSSTLEIDGATGNIFMRNMLGIGVNPSYALDVAGVAHFDAGGANGLIISSANGHQDSITAGTGDTILLNSGTGNAVLMVGGYNNDTYDPSIICQAPSTYFTGAVRIGDTNVPSYPLEVCLVSNDLKIVDLEFTGATGFHYSGASYRLGVQIGASTYWIPIFDSVTS